VSNFFVYGAARGDAIRETTNIAITTIREDVKKKRKKKNKTRQIARIYSFIKIFIVKRTNSKTREYNYLSQLENDIPTCECSNS